MDVLELLAGSGRAMSHTEISLSLQIPKSSLTQLLRNLELRHYLAQRLESGHYVLGPAILELARRAAANADIAQIAQPIVDRIARETRETSSCNVLRDTAAERVCGTNSVQPLRYWMTVGEMLPLHASSGAKAIIAFLPDEQRKTLLSTIEYRRFTAHTIADAVAYRRELQRILREGVAYSDEEIEIGVLGVSVPVFDAANQPIASLTVVIPSARDTPEHRAAIIAALQSGATALRATFGPG